MKKIQLNNQMENLNKENVTIKEENKSKSTQLCTYQKRIIDLATQKNQLSQELEEVTKLKDELLLKVKLVRYMPFKNIINEISNKFTCCVNNCINSNLSDGTCDKKQGFVRINENGIVKYHLADEKVNNKICFYAQHQFTRNLGFCCYFSLFYFEITMIEETKDRNCYAAIDFDDLSPHMFLYNGPASTIFNLREKEKFYRKCSWKDKDVFDCGVVFPGSKEKGAFPYMFFTKNGRRTGSKIYMNEKDEDNLRPCFELLSCSIEINFGSDLAAKPFRYDTLKHKI
uniref:SPRY domain-containing protein n=1 Tax=Meloidogyne hapla TaxID=6305 RepID=A0A1I8B5N9_MELHA